MFDVMCKKIVIHSKSKLKSQDLNPKKSSNIIIKENKRAKFDTDCKKFILHLKEQK